jgi:competence protein ComEA
MKTIISLIVGIVALIITLITFNLNTNLKVYPTTYDYQVRDVYIGGAVEIPGFYTVNNEMTLKDLIKLAKGLRPEADVEKLNLKQVLKKDSYEIPFYRHDLYDSDQQLKKVNLNTATFEQLKSISGFTDRIINAFFEYRQQVVTIYSVDELLLVKYIGPATFEKVKDFVTV